MSKDTIPIQNCIIEKAEEDSSADEKEEEVFSFNLKESYQVFSNGPEDETFIDTTFIIVDDEHMIRNSTKRVIFKTIEGCSKNVSCKVIEAADGIECILALYIANLIQIKIDAIISDETMTYISGSYSSKIIDNIMKDGKFAQTPMFVSTALSHTNIGDKYSGFVKKIYSKPLDKNSVKDIFKQCDLLDFNTN